MITIRFSGRAPSPRQTAIGMETDQRSETIRFLLPQIADSQSAQLMILLPDGTADEMQIRDGQVTLPARITEIPGRSRAWVEILGMDDTVTWNSEIFYLEVGDLPPISERTEQQYPTAIQEALAACVRAEGFSEAAIQAAKLVLAANGLLNVREENRVLIVERCALSDTDAYALAVRNGFTGTQAEWEAAVLAISGDMITINEAKQKAEQALTLAQQAQAAAQAAAASAAAAAALLSKATVTVAASAWQNASAPYTATVSCAAATASNVIVVSVSAPDSAAGYDALAEYGILCTGQAAGQITLKAFKEKPASELTVNVLGVNI